MSTPLYSVHFQRPIVLTHHAAIRMNERSISAADLVSVIDAGQLRYKDASHAWAFKYFAERDDNLLCAVLVLEDSVVVKTVLHHFELED